MKRRHVPYNQLGVEMSTELSGWEDVLEAFRSAGNTPSGEHDKFLQFVTEGRSHIDGLREYMHTGSRPESLDLRRAGLWNQLSRKQHRKRGDEIEVAMAVAASRDDDAASPDDEVDLREVLLPEVMLANLANYMGQPWSEDLALLAQTYLDDVLDLEELEPVAADLVLTIAKAGYCTRSIAIDTMDQAREESIETTLLEWNTEHDEDGDPVFVVAANMAGDEAGLAERPVDDPLLQAAWLVVPGIGDIQWFKRLADRSMEQTITWFVEEVPDFEWQAGLTDDVLFSSWLFGYFLRVQEQYAPVDDLFSGVRDWLQSPD